MKLRFLVISDALFEQKSIPQTFGDQFSKFKPGFRPFV
jgi:hypothetical protein